MQKHYFADPPRIERGWRHHLVDVSGRVYLDGINNVAVLGHSHPAVADAVDRALRTLNTNSRFHYAAHVEFAEMLLATMPAGLDRVFLLVQRVRDGGPRPAAGPRAHRGPRHDRPAHGLPRLDHRLR